MTEEREYRSLCLDCRYYQMLFPEQPNPDIHYCNHYDRLLKDVEVYLDRTGQACWRPNNVPHLHRCEHGGWMVNVNDARLFKLICFDQMTIWFDFEKAIEKDEVVK